MRSPRGRWKDRRASREASEWLAEVIAHDDETIVIDLAALERDRDRSP